jgi:hypothetical protein
MKDAGPSRRSVLAATALLAAAACTKGNAPQPKPTVNPDVAIRRAVRADVAALVALYDVNVRAHPGLADRLGPLAGETTAHLEALREPAPLTSTATPSDTAATSATAPSVAAATTPAAAVAALATAEQQAGRRRVTQLGGASPALARLIAAIGASEATHAALLRSSR